MRDLLKLLKESNRNPVDLRVFDALALYSYVFDCSGTEKALFDAGFTHGPLGAWYVVLDDRKCCNDHLGGIAQQGPDGPVCCNCLAPAKRVTREWGKVFGSQEEALKRLFGKTSREEH